MKILIKFLVFLSVAFLLSNEVFSKTLDFKCRSSNQNYVSRFDLKGSLEIPDDFKNGDELIASIESFQTIKRGKDIIINERSDLNLRGVLSYYKAGRISAKAFYRFSTAPDSSFIDEETKVRYFNLMIGFPAMLSSSMQLTGSEHDIAYFSTCRF